MNWYIVNINPPFLVNPGLHGRLISQIIEIHFKGLTSLNICFSIYMAGDQTPDIMLKLDIYHLCHTILLLHTHHALSFYKQARTLILVIWVWKAEQTINIRDSWAEKSSNRRFSTFFTFFIRTLCRSFVSPENLSRLYSVGQRMCVFLVPSDAMKTTVLCVYMYVLSFYI